MSAGNSGVPLILNSTRSTAGPEWCEEFHWPGVARGVPLRFRYTDSFGKVQSHTVNSVAPPPCDGVLAQIRRLLPLEEGGFLPVLVIWTPVGSPCPLVLQALFNIICPAPPLVSGFRSLNICI